MAAIKSICHTGEDAEKASTMDEVGDFGFYNLFRSNTARAHDHGGAPHSRFGRQRRHRTDVEPARRRFPEYAMDAVDVGLETGDAV